MPDTLERPSLLSQIAEKREAAYKELEEFVTPLLSNTDHELTDEERSKQATLKQKVVDLDERLTELTDLETRNAGFAERRAQINSGVDPRVEVTYEPTVYGEGSPNSYVADFVRASKPDWNYEASQEAIARLLRASHEVNVELAQANEPKKIREIEGIFREAYRYGGKDKAQQAVKEARERGRAGLPAIEARAIDTTATSGGSFTTPIYFVNKYAAWREAGRAFADECNKQPLPDYGMTLYLPHVTGPAGVNAQVGQNTGITEVDPGAGYLASNLTTMAGQVTVAQQMLDRAGPNFSYDSLVFDQLSRDYNPKIDAYILAQALAAAGTTAGTYTDASGFTIGPRTAPGVGGFTGAIAGAKVAVRTTAGTFMNPTHLFMQTDRWEFVSAWVDSNGRPVVVPNYAGAFNAIAAGSNTGDAGIEGNTGYKLAGLPAYQDTNIPNDSSARDQAIVGALDEVWYWEGSLIPRTLPQTVAQNLSVILQVYSYVGCIVPYPNAIQTVSGSGMASINF